MELKIRNGIAIVDKDLAPILSIFKWHKHGRGYASALVQGKQTFMHRLIMGAGEHDIVDHINGNPLDNRRENLRFVTKSQNAQNSRKAPSTTGFIGVSLDKGYYRAYIKRNGQRENLWHSDDAIECAIIYDFLRRSTTAPMLKQTKNI